MRWPSVTIVFLVFNRRDELRTSLRKMLEESDYEGEAAPARGADPLTAARGPQRRPGAALGAAATATTRSATATTRTAPRRSNSERGSLGCALRRSLVAAPVTSALFQE